MLTHPHVSSVRVDACVKCTCVCCICVVCVLALPQRSCPRVAGPRPRHPTHGTDITAPPPAAAAYAVSMCTAHTCLYASPALTHTHTCLCESMAACASLWHQQCCAIEAHIHAPTCANLWRLTPAVFHPCHTNTCTHAHRHAPRGQQGRPPLCCTWLPLGTGCHGPCTAASTITYPSTCTRVWMCE